MSDDDWRKQFDYKFTTFGTGRWIRQRTKPEDIKRFIAELLGKTNRKCGVCGYLVLDEEYRMFKFPDAMKCPRCCGVFISDFERI